jgi:hypothetical protein
LLRCFDYRKPPLTPSQKGVEKGDYREGRWEGIVAFERVISLIEEVVAISLSIR